MGIAPLTPPSDIPAAVVSVGTADRRSHGSAEARMGFCVVYEVCTEIWPSVPLRDALICAPKL